MQEWSGSVSALAGQGIVAAAEIAWSGDCIVRLRLDSPVCQIDYAISDAGISSTSLADDAVRSVEIISMAPASNAYLVRVMFTAALDGATTATWTVLDGEAYLALPSLTTV
jgi:hypothetical protein